MCKPSPGTNYPATRKGFYASFRKLRGEPADFRKVESLTLRLTKGHAQTGTLAPLQLRQNPDNLLLNPAKSRTATDVVRGIGMRKKQLR
jgi:hypothetical protein